MTVQAQPISLVSPYGGPLVDLLALANEARELRARAAELPQVPMALRAQLDLELLATGGFSPLTTFMGEADYRSVCEGMRLANGTVFPLPVTLPVGDGIDVRAGTTVTLCDETRQPLAVMDVHEVFARDWRVEARHIYGSDDLAHPVIAEMAAAGRRQLSGPLRVFRLPVHHDFLDLRLTPAQSRARLAALGRPHVVAFNTRNPLHRVHEEITRRAMRTTGASLLLHPIVGMTRPGDVDPFTRVRIYRRIVERYFEREPVVLALLPLAMRMAGPREAVWHAIIRRNFGASHFIVGRDHAGPGNDSRGRPFFPPEAAPALATRLAPEIGVEIVAFPELVYAPERDAYVSREEAAQDRTVAVSGTRVRTEIAAGGSGLAAWMIRPEAAEELARAYPPPGRQGFCVWITGLSGSGKTTVADILSVRIQERGRRVTLLDGDIIRSTISSDLSFSRQDRDTQVRRTGVVAAEAVRHHGAVVCASLSPFAGSRAEVRQMIGRESFLLVYLDTPIDVCRGRDPKGLYARAGRGLIAGMTGMESPFEPPGDADLTLSTEHVTPDAVVAVVLAEMEKRGFILPAAVEPAVNR